MAPTRLPVHHRPAAHKVKCFRTLVSDWPVVFRSPQMLEISQNFLNPAPNLHPPFFDGQRPAQAPEQDMSLFAIEERYRSVNGGWVGGILALLTPWAHRLQAADRLMRAMRPFSGSKGVGT